jgi:phosphoglycolate phosphatase
MPIIRIEDGADKGKTIPLTMRKLINIGRDPMADISIRDSKSSRFHARVECRPDGIFLVDLNSKNGTFVNGLAVRETRLNMGDHFLVGDSVFVLAPDPAPQPPRPPSGATTAVARGDTIAKRLQAFYRLQDGKERGAGEKGPSRFIVFEIDGTLISTDGMVHDAFEQAIQEVYGVAHALANLPVSGRSEREIIQVALRTAKVPPEKIDPFIARALARYVDILVEMIRKRPRGNIHPGVRNLLERLDKDARWAVGLMTRHLLLSARPLLGRHGLWDFFKYGVFADDHENRTALPGLLLERAREASGLPIQPTDVYAVGDTVRDLACAKAAGMRTVAVATGGSTHEALAVLNPYMIFHSFENVDDVLSKLNADMP